MFALSRFGKQQIGAALERGVGQHRLAAASRAHNRRASRHPLQIGARALNIARVGAS